MALEITFVEIREALESSGECFLCTLERDLEQRYTDHYLYEEVMDPASRAKIVASRGFCNYHFYEMLSEAGRPRTADGLGMALIMESVNKALIEEIKGQLEATKDVGESESSSLATRTRLVAREVKSRLLRTKSRRATLLSRQIHRMLSLRNPCPACEHIDTFVNIFVDFFINALNERSQRIAELFADSKGLCVPHYMTVMCRLDEKLPDLKKGPVAKQIVEVQLKNMRRLNTEFSEYVRKHDYRFSKEPWGSEQDVVPRGVAKLSGKQGVRRAL